LSDVATDAKRLTGAKCKAKNRRGERCGGLAGSDGLCSAHRDPGRMKELGARGGRARRKGVAEQLPAGERQSLREFLREGLDHETIKAAIERSLAGGIESARVACVELLSDLELYRKDGDECPRCAAWKAEAPAAREQVWQMISRYVEHSVRSELGVGRPVDERNDSQASRLVRDAVRRGLAGREHDLEVGIQTAVGKILDRISNGLVVDNVVDADRATQILEGLEELGLVSGRETIEKRVEELAQERLAALKAEHGLAV
jgi:hypothetical protein